MGGLADIVEKLVPVVGPEGDAPIRVAALAPAPLLLEEHGDDRHHIGVAAEMIGLHE